MKNKGYVGDISSVQTALKQQREGMGKETRPYHYVNEIHLIRYSMTGFCKTPIDFGSLSVKDSHLLHRVICLNRRLIKLHVDYKQRKQACRQLAQKLQSKI